MDMKLGNKSAVVSGSTAGIGYAIASVLTADRCRVHYNASQIKTMDGGGLASPNDPLGVTESLTAGLGCGHSTTLKSTGTKS